MDVRAKTDKKIRNNPKLHISSILKAPSTTPIKELLQHEEIAETMEITESQITENRNRPNKNCRHQPLQQPTRLQEPMPRATAIKRIKHQHRPPNNLEKTRNA
jgi:hypothetical protein